ncbi:SIMPL domain-containing protein [Pikeienuella sp. HZG-20]|uniref:SIMPL domain-containing protein n=1 Tax=Paludibacillus litoralis TaxID=3133267 RepID=UPI0030EEA6BC
MRTPGIAVALLFIALAAPPTLADATLTVRGEGRASAAPDLAVVRIGVETRAPDAEAALEANSREAAALIAEAKARGVADADIQTSGLSLHPVYDDQRPRTGDAPRLSGFQAANEVTVRLRAIGDVGTTLGALVGAGANRLNGIEFGLADDRALTDAARRGAVADAVRKATLYAEAAGVRLGEIRTIEEEGAGPQPRFAMRAMADRSEGAPVETGETVVTASVRVVWEIGDDD